MARRTRPDRLRGRKEFEAVLAHDRALKGRYFVVKALARELAIARLGIIAARKAMRRAIDRNRCKRIVREAFRAHAKDLVGLDVVIVCRVAVPGRKRTLARRELKRLLACLAAADQRADVGNGVGPLETRG